MCCIEIQISNNFNTYRLNFSLYLSQLMGVLVSVRFNVTICSTVFVTVIVTMEVTVVVSVACDVGVNLVGSSTSTEASCTDDELKHVSIGDNVVSMKGGDVIV